MEPIPVEELKTEKFPRISAEDLIELSELHGPMSGLSPTKRSKSAKPILVVVDVRPEDEYPLRTESTFCVHCFIAADVLRSTVLLIPS